MTLMGLVVDLTYHLTYQPQINQWQSQQMADLETYLSEEKRFKSHPVFKPRAKLKGDLAETIAQLQEGDSLEHLISRDYKKEILSMGPQWLEQKHKISMTDTLRDFFDNIDQFDHWTLPANVQINQASDLIVAGQVLLAFSFHHQPDAIKASLEKTRHLSLILLQTPVLNFKRAGLSLLEKENQFMQHLSSRFHKAQLLWTPVNREELKSFRKHLGQTAHYLSHLSSPQLLRSVFLNNEKPLAFCSVLYLKLPLLQWGRQFLSPQFIFEPNFRETLALVDEVQSVYASQCPPSPDSHEIKSSWIRLIPYYRRIFGIKLILNAEVTGKIP